MKAAIILKDAYLDNFDNCYDIIIGCDRGALHAINNNIIPDIAIGDFDSVNKNEYELIENKIKKIIKLNPVKDESDTHEAIEYVKNYDLIEVLGGISGKRIEHLFSNIIDLINYNNVIMKDKYSLIEIINNNDYSFRKEYKYVSIFAIDDSLISLKGFKYNISDYLLKRNDPLCLSNEIINNPKIDIKSGKLLVIYSYSD